MLAAAMVAGPALINAQAATQSTEASPSTQIRTSPTTAPVTADCCRIAAGTLVEIEIAEPLSSKEHKRGQKFAIKLHSSLLDGQRIVIPAGVVGVGEIVHAERSRGGGKPGEMLLAARYLEHNGIQVPLRGFKLGGQGRDNTKAALSVSMVLGPFAHFIHGNEIEIPAGTVATARLAQDIGGAESQPTEPSSPISPATYPTPAIADESPKE